MSEFGDSERMLARALAEVQRNEPWLARRRLRQYLRDQPFDARFARALGELELARGEYPEAGRWLWIAGSHEPEHADLVRAHLENTESGDRLWSSLPRSLRTGVDDRDFPPHVLDALLERGVDARAKRAAISKSKQRPPDHPIGTIAAFAGFAFVIFLIVFGAIRFIEMLVD